MLDGEFAPEEEREADYRRDGECDDEAGTEPVVFLALVEHDLQGADGDDEQSEAPIIDAFASLANFSEVGRVFDDAVGEIERQDADRNIEEEDPAPTVVVDDPAAHGGAKHRRHDDRDTVHGEGHAALLGWEGVGEDGLLAGLKASSCCSLKDAAEDQSAERRRNSAKERGEGEQEDAAHVEALATHAVGNPAADGEHHGVCDEVACEHPRSLVGTGREGTANVEHRDVGDGGVEGLHERGQGDCDGNEPGVRARPPRFVECECRCGHCCSFLFRRPGAAALFRSRFNRLPDLVEVEEPLEAMSF